MNDTQQTNPEPMLSATQLAALTSMKPATILRLARTGEIPSFRFGRKNIRFRKSDIEKCGFREAIKTIVEPAS